MTKNLKTQASGHWVASKAKSRDGASKEDAHRGPGSAFLVRGSWYKLRPCGRMPELAAGFQPHSAFPEPGARTGTGAALCCQGTGERSPVSGAGWPDAPSPTQLWNRRAANISKMNKQLRGRKEQNPPNKQCVKSHVGQFTSREKKLPIKCIVCVRKWRKRSFEIKDALMATS